MYLCIYVHPIYLIVVNINFSPGAPFLKTPVRATGGPNTSTPRTSGRRDLAIGRTVYPRICNGRFDDDVKT